MSEHTQKEIDREAEQVFPYPNRDFCLDRKDYEQSCALVDLKRIVWIAGRSKSISRERELEEALLQIAKSTHAYVDFSDKTYDGDKETPMDAIGFIQFLGNKVKQTNEFICHIAKLLGEDDLGFDGKQWTIDDFKDAISEKDSRIRELEEALRELVNDWEGEEPFKDEPVYKQDTEHNFGYWSPAAKMVKAELIFKAKQLLKS